MASSISSLPFESHAKLRIEASEANIARMESPTSDLEPFTDRDRGIHNLPVELLVEVLRWTLDCASSRYYFGWNTMVKQVYALSHVCAHWRQVAIATPHLWADVLPLRLIKTLTDAYLTGLKEWLNRSAPLPIHIHFDCPGRDVDEAAVMGVFMTAAHRCSNAHLEFKSLSVLSNIPSHRLEHLRKLTLRSGDWNSVATVAFSLAPNLTEVSLETRHIAQLRMPWFQLAHLRVVASCSQECLDALLQCQNLVTVFFYWLPPWPGHPDVSGLKPVTLGKLESFRLVMDNTVGSVTPFFASLRLPALKHLDLHVDDWPTSEFAEFQLRSPNIETLTISCSDLASADLMTILCHAPGLLTLNVVSCGDAFDVSIATALSSSHQAPAQLAPRLHTLSILRCGDLLGEDTAIALIAARWWTDEQVGRFPSPPQVSRWSSLDLGRDDDIADSPEFTAKLEDYREQGLHVRA
ncbi:hypothetical protein C8R46DRAFT_559367 [Mycena filopes]|nr:hypothetical protein C8R46DRAFT_559367 [Mycena filopes]